MVLDLMKPFLYRADDDRKTTHEIKIVTDNLKKRYDEVSYTLLKQ
jgi:predicted ATPase